MKKIIDEILLLLDRKCPKLMGGYQKIRFIITKDDDIFWKSNHFEKRNLGVNSKEKYCIFKMPYPNYALFAAARHYVFMYEWAVSKGFTPLMDMEYQCSFNRREIGTDNKWEYCFQQPISVSDAKKKNYVYLREGILNTFLKKTCMDINGKKDDIYIHATSDNWREYYGNINKYVKKCWIFNTELLDSYEKEYGTKMKKTQNIVGVFLRENFSEEFFQYLDAHDKEIYKRHPKAPDIETTIQIVKDYMDRWKCDYIFLSTVYQDSVERFQIVFGDKVIVADRVREKSIADSIKARGKGFNATEQEIYQQGLKVNHRERLTSYAKEIIALSRCDYLIAAKGGGAIAALSLNGGKYRDMCILEDQNKSEWY